MILAQMLEDPLFRDLIDDFIAEMPERIARLRSAAAGGDVETIRHLAHQLKGAGGGYGFDNISLSAARVEKYYLEEATSEELSHSIEQLANEVEAACRSWKES